ncbi:hypothetical protein DTO164E3_6562 [Paecilomyces variotii]|nr:hypothetical protein DTO164E3_6562 [Paecilomyces variotii]KAJ9197480.1 hypothetical protein DTO032I3_5962 [Paecilomyces variotii]KAJ9222792.1 hypothetical protein DTO169C6_4807 [Paecilomyces variotii]KAJ9275205.1 hypothetical protein DTO021D3_7963 [Paecilomyces variotii]KAJ9312171.1 hypothetical protein DTO271D3_7613 [Paecilomyces variotii]
MDLHHILRSGRELSQDYNYNHEQQTQTQTRAARSQSEFESSPPSESHSPPSSLFSQPSTMHRFPTSSSGSRRRSSSSYFSFGSRKPRAFWSEQEQILIMRWCLGHKNHFADKNYTKREFWNACTGWMQRRFGRFIVRPDKSIQTWETRRRKEIEMERGTGVPLPKTEWRGVMDEWLEFLGCVKMDAGEWGHDNADAVDATVKKRKKKNTPRLVVEESRNEMVDAMAERRILEEHGLITPLGTVVCDSGDIRSSQSPSTTIPADPVRTDTTEMETGPCSAAESNSYSHERPEMRGSEGSNDIPGGEDWPLRIDLDAEGAKWFALSYIIRNVEMLRDEVGELAKMQRQLAIMVEQIIESKPDR